MKLIVVAFLIVFISFEAKAQLASERQLSSYSNRYSVNATVSREENNVTHLPSKQQDMPAIKKPVLVTAKAKNNNRGKSSLPSRSKIRINKLAKKPRQHRNYIPN
jgi:hypothetical protein